MQPPNGVLRVHNNSGVIGDHTSQETAHMGTARVAITIDQATLARLDELVKRKVFPSRSSAIQQAISDKLARVERSRLARMCQA